MMNPMKIGLLRFMIINYTKKSWGDTVGLGGEWSTLDVWIKKDYFFLAREGSQSRCNE